MGTAGKSIADFFASSHIDDKLENHHTGATTQERGIYPDHQTSQSVTSGREYRLFLLQIETEGACLVE